MIRATFRASVSSGALVFAEPARFAAWCALAKDQPIQVVLEREPKRRSLQANARYWAGIVPFAAEVFEQRTGLPFTPSMTHHALKLAFLGHVDVMVGGELIFVPKTTTKLTTAEFSSYCERIEAWISEEFQVKPELLHEAHA